jgi:hypothetical protein
VLCFSARSWVSASLDGLICLPAQRSRGEKRREKRERVGGVFPPAVLPVFVAGLGRSGWSACPRMGVRAWGSPLLGSLPLLFFPCLARLVSAPGCGVPSVAYVGLLFPCLAWLLVARCPLAFPRLCPFLSLCSLIIISLCTRVTRF